MAENNPFWNRNWFRVIELFFLPLLAFICCFIFWRVDETQKIQIGCVKDIEAIRKQIDEDQAQWDLLKKYDNYIRDLQIEVEVVRKIQDIERGKAYYSMMQTVSKTQPSEVAFFSPPPKDSAPIKPTTSLPPPPPPATTDENVMPDKGLNIVLDKVEEAKEARKQSTNDFKRSQIRQYREGSK